MLVVAWFQLSCQTHTQVWGWDMRPTAPSLWNLVLARWKQLQRNQLRSISETVKAWSACASKEKGRLPRQWDFQINLFNSVASTQTRICCSHSIIHHLLRRRSCCHKDGFFCTARSDSSWQVRASVDGCTGWVNSPSATLRNSSTVRVEFSQWKVQGAFVLQVNGSLYFQLEQQQQMTQHLDTYDIPTCSNLVQVHRVFLTYPVNHDINVIQGFVWKTWWSETPWKI